MEIKVLAQITQDGYIARPDGQRDWYINPDKFGINTFFDKAAAILDYKDGECLAEYPGNETFSGKTLGEFIRHMNNSDGYIAIEVNPHNLSFVDSLITGHAVTELHCIQIPTCLEEGIQWPAFIKAKPQLQIAEQKVLTDQRFLYIIYRFTPVPGTCQ